MEFQIETLKTHTLIKVLAARLETHIASALKSELVLIFGKGEKNIILDLYKCKYCDAAGLSAILAGNRLCHNSGGVFVLIGLNGQFKRLITISHLDDVLSIAGSVQEAVKQLRKCSGPDIIMNINPNSQDADSMTFQIEKFETHTLIKVFVEKLEKHIASSLKKELTNIGDFGEKNIILDLSNCCDIDSTGASALLVGNKLCKDKAGIFILTGTKGAIERLITIFQLDSVLMITGSIQEAEVLIKESKQIT